MLIKIWYGLISSVLFISLVALISSFELSNSLHWMWLLILIIASVLTILVYLHNPLKNKKEKNLEKTYSEFLMQKDKVIEELKQKNQLMFKTSLKKAEADVELSELKRRMEEKLREETTS